jgi:hypothetical protein
MKNSYLIGTFENGSKICISCNDSKIDDAKKIIENTLSNKVTLIKTTFFPYKLFSWGFHNMA